MLYCIGAISQNVDLFAISAYYFFGLIAVLIPPTEDVFLGETYGKRNVFLDFFRESSKMIFFLLGLFLFARSLYVAANLASLLIIFFYVIIILIPLFPLMKFTKGTEKKFNKKHREERRRIAYSNPIFLRIIEIWNSSGGFSSLYILLCAECRIYGFGILNFSQMDSLT